jgi:hypothetical protein
MKMRPMPSANRPTGSTPRTKPNGKPVVRKLSRKERTLMSVITIFAAGHVLFYFATGLAPVLTGRCLRCVLTGNYHCAWQPHVHNDVHHDVH